jgi:hypothetical protein
MMPEKLPAIQSISMQVTISPSKYQLMIAAQNGAVLKMTEKKLSGKIWTVETIIVKPMKPTMILIASINFFPSGTCSDWPDAINAVEETKTLSTVRASE